MCGCVWVGRWRGWVCCWFARPVSIIKAAQLGLWVADGGWMELEDLFSPSVELWLLRHERLVVCRGEHLEDLPAQISCV